MFTLVRRVRSRFTRNRRDRGGPVLEFAVVFGIVAVIAIAVWQIVGDENSGIAGDIASAIQDGVSEALGGEGGGSGVDCNIVPAQDREACQEAQDNWGG